MQYSKHPQEIILLRIQKHWMQYLMLIHFGNSQFCYGTFHPYFSFNVYPHVFDSKIFFMQKIFWKIYFSFAILFSGDIVSAAGGNYTSMAATGGVVAIHIKVKITLIFVSQNILSGVTYGNFCFNGRMISIIINKSTLLINANFNAIINFICIWHFFFSGSATSTLTFMTIVCQSEYIQH